MRFHQLDIPNCFLVESNKFIDERGAFLKTFQQSNFTENIKDVTFKESYYSSSIKGVLRGMHFQLPPYDHDKLIYVSSGEIIDVVLDLRIGSPTFKSFQIVKLNAFGKSIFVPKGCAHGFLTISDNAVVNYSVTTEYNQLYDTGIRWDSFGYDWGEEQIIISDRDKSFIPLSKFNSPFLF